MSNHRSNYSPQNFSGDDSELLASHYFLLRQGDPKEIDEFLENHPELILDWTNIVVSIAKNTWSSEAERRKFYSKYENRIDFQKSFDSILEIRTGPTLTPSEIALRFVFDSHRIDLVLSVIEAIINDSRLIEEDREFWFQEISKSFSEELPEDVFAVLKCCQSRRRAVSEEASGFESGVEL